jgi:hypothetical protein
MSCAAPAAAQTVRMEFRNGRVSLSAQNAPVRIILAEWARVGGTKVVNAERVAGAPLTIELTNVPERQALDIILRNVSGYMAGPRQVAATVGVSTYDRIMILPTSAPARAAVPPPQTAQQIPSPFVPQIDPDDPEENPATDVVQQPGPGPGGRGRGFGPQRFPPPGPNGPVATQPFPPQTQPDPDDDPQPGTATPPNPFGITPGSARPGVITPVPQQPQRIVRPNGDPEP